MHPKPLTIYGDQDPASTKQIETCLEHDSAVAGALMADHHLGYSMPIGGVIAYRGAISPSGVGYDIACGNKAVRLDVPGEEVRKHISGIMDEIFSKISFGVGRVNNEKVEDPVLDDPAWETVQLVSRKVQKLRGAKDMARAQLGTVGSGNHYVDIFVDEEDRTWIGVHFGSRGLGHRIATHFIKAGGGTDGMHVPPVVLSEQSELGQQYIECMTLAGKYAYAGRDWVCGKVAKIIGGTIVEEIHNHHNFAWKENHPLLGGDVWVVRKGATPAFPHQKGFVGASMGERSVILEGRVDFDSSRTLFSTVHGAGRVMSRTEAAGKTKWCKETKQRITVRAGAISQDMMKGWVEGAGVELRGGGTDESPHCYKRLKDVLSAQGGTVQVLQWLRPIGVAMAGAGIIDPYKD